MNEKPQSSTFILRLVELQRIVSILFMCMAPLIPAYVFFTYRLNVLPVYDSAGQITGHANYFVVSLFFAVFWFSLAVCCYLAARSFLARRRSGDR